MLHIEFYFLLRSERLAVTWDPSFLVAVSVANVSTTGCTCRSRNATWCFWATTTGLESFLAGLAATATATGGSSKASIFKPVSSSSAMLSTFSSNVLARASGGAMTSEWATTILSAGAAGLRRVTVMVKTRIKEEYGGIVCCNVLLSR
jgi:hypothetical protein